MAKSMKTVSHAFMHLKCFCLLVYQFLLTFALTCASPGVNPNVLCIHRSVWLLGLVPLRDPSLVCGRKEETQGRILLPGLSAKLNLMDDQYSIRKQLHCSVENFKHVDHP